MASSKWMRLFIPLPSQYLSITVSPSVCLLQLQQRPADDRLGERRESDGAFFLWGLPFRQAPTPEDVNRVPALPHQTLPRGRLHPAHAGNFFFLSFKPAKLCWLVTSAWTDVLWRNRQICGRRRRRDEASPPPGASGNALLTAGPIITRSGTNNRFQDRLHSPEHKLVAPLVGGIPASRSDPVLSHHVVGAEQPSPE